MGILAALFSAASRKLGQLLQAVFGWSVLSMFGKLSSKKQTLITLALVLSLFWPVFVLGVFVPKAAAFFIAFVPGHKAISAGVLRVLWLLLALFAPVIVGLLTRVASPPLKAKGFLASMVLGYPLTLGYFLSFLITLFVVPVVKLQTLKRRWTDEHVFVQTRKGCYVDAVYELCEGAAMAGYSPRAAPAPRPMGFALKVLKFFARSAIDSLVADHPIMVKAQNCEMFLYPGDLLIRGGKIEVARLRALLGQTKLEKHAYLVEQPKAQELQDDLGRLWEVVDRHENPSEIGDNARSRLEGIVHESTKANLTFDEWLVLDRIARRIEARLQDRKSLVDEATRSEDFGRPVKNELALPVDRPLEHPLREASVIELVERGMKEASRLARLEVEIAKAEAAQQVKEATRAAIGFALGAVLFIVTLALAAVALVFAIKATAVTALAVAGGVLVVALILAGVGYSMLPKTPLAATRKHVTGDLKQLKEHLA